MSIDGLTKILSDGGHLTVHNGRILPQSRWAHWLSPRSEVEKVIACVENHLKAGQQSPNPNLESSEVDVSLADALINRYKRDPTVTKIIERFDRNVALHRPTVYYQTEVNQRGLDKWKRARQNPEIYRGFPEFVAFLETSRLLSQIRISKDRLEIINGEPAILVEGRWIQQINFYERFELIEAPAFGGRPFIVERSTRDVYTYLDNGKGLEKHHPYLSDNHPISTLNEEEYARTWECAKSFVRENEAELSVEAREVLNQDRPFVLQYVTSRMNCGNSNFSNLLLNPKHPYLRLIVGVDNPEAGTRKGEVYEVGYGWKQRPCLPMSVSKGQFQSPDPWEYACPDERIVTNIPISQLEAQRFRDFVLRHHKNGVNLGFEPGFSLTSQNCSVFAKEACRAAGINVSTGIGPFDLIGTICPSIIQKAGRQIALWMSGAKEWVCRMAKRFVPGCVSSFGIQISARLSALLVRIRDAFIAFVLTPLRALLGGASGKGGVEFRQGDGPPVPLEPSLRNPRNWFRINTIYLPGVAQEWQMQQASTVIYQKPVQLSIVPPPPQ